MLQIFLWSESWVHKMAVSSQGPCSCSPSSVCVCVCERERERGREKVGGERRSSVVCVAWVMKKVFCLWLNKLFLWFLKQKNWNVWGRLSLSLFFFFFLGLKIWILSEPEEERMMKSSRVLLVILWLQLICKFGAFLWDHKIHYLGSLSLLGSWRNMNTISLK